MRECKIRNQELSDIGSDVLSILLAVLGWKVDSTATRVTSNSPRRTKRNTSNSRKSGMLSHFWTAHISKLENFPVLDPTFSLIFLVLSYI